MRILPAAVAALLVCAGAPLTAQVKVELEAGGGYTIVDAEAVAERDGETATDWGEGMYRFAARAFFTTIGNFEVGAEAAYQYLYWYSVKVPYVPNPIRRAYDVDATTVAAVLRFKGASATVDLDGGVAFLSDPVAMVGGSVGWALADKLTIRFRADGMFGHEVTIPLGLHLTYSLGSFGG